MFRHETKDDSSFGIGVLFQDGSFESLKIQRDEQGFENLVRINYNSEIDGRIIGLANDREHSRMLYVISEAPNGKAKFWGFTSGRLYEFSNVQVTRKSKILPFFSPADNSQVIIMEPEQNMFRIWEHETLENGDVNMKRVKKYDLPDMTSKSNFGSCHTAICTEDEELLILVDKVDMHIFDLREALAKPVGQAGFNLPEPVTHEQVNIQGLQLIENRYMYIMFNKTVQPLL